MKLQYLISDIKLYFNGGGLALQEISLKKPILKNRNDDSVELEEYERDVFYGMNNTHLTTTD